MWCYSCEMPYTYIIDVPEEEGWNKSGFTDMLVLQVSMPKILKVKMYLRDT